MKTSIEWKPSFEPPDQGFEFLYVNGVYRGNICRGQRLDQGALVRYRREG